ncbi:hypothetical protein [Streptomyces sp. NPDC048332]|uniref:hypothetical protein n=1 Tax=Streptomyces sp. NPDC048332 TaxID=3154619 RepID=UPI003449455D
MTALHGCERVDGQPLEGRLAVEAGSGRGQYLFWSPVATGEYSLDPVRTVFE